MLTRRIREKALELGFDAVGVAPAGPAPHAEAFRRWLARDHHGAMRWLARDPERRCDPRLVLPNARSVVIVGLSYATEPPPPALWDDPLRGRVARYAWGRDYHKVMEPMLRALLDFIRAESGSPTTGRYYVDTGPVLERDWAAQSGLGFIGRNTLLIRPGLGSLLFLGTLLLDRELEQDPPPAVQGLDPSRDALSKDWTRGKAADCGTCRRCLDVCPTHAFPSEYILDSRRCISYLTIEHREAIPEELRPLMGNWIYGCDACQEVCPWVRRFSQPGRIRWLAFDPDLFAPRLTELLALDEEGFRARYRGTPLLRTKRSGLLRNAAVALGNSGCREAAPALEAAVRDPDPLIRGHAAWALRRLGA